MLPTSGAFEIAPARYVEGANWDLEVGCLAELSCEMDGPLLLFDGFEGYPRGYRVSTNSVRTPRRFALAMDFPLDAHPVDLVRLSRERRERFQPLAPTVVADGPGLECQQEYGGVDVTRFPVPRWHEHDGGRYLGTGDLVILRDPKGFRPLCYAQDGPLFAAASESVPLSQLGFREVHTLEPGEMIPAVRCPTLAAGTGRACCSDCACRADSGAVEIAGAHACRVA